MKNKMYIVAILGMGLIYGCSSQEEKVENEIKQLQSQLSDDFTVETGDSLMKKHEEYLEIVQDDKKAAEAIFNAAKHAVYISQYAKALDLFSKIRNQYPDSKWSEDALFMTAFVYDEHLSNPNSKDLTNDPSKKTAEKFYKEFLDTYPESKMAESAQTMLNQLYLTDEQIIASFENKLSDSSNTKDSAKNLETIE